MPLVDVHSSSDETLLSLLVTRGKDCVSTIIDGETVILNVSTGIYSGADAVGTFVWGLLEKPVKVADVCERILEQYDVDADACKSDLLKFLRSLADNRLIEARDTVAA